jgi:DNA-binding HxlR family transcriptional regulator
VSGRIFSQHQALLDASALTTVVVDARGYVSVDRKADLERRGFAPRQRNVPALVVPLFSVTGEPAGFQCRPDEPRFSNDGKPIKYETPAGMGMVLDVHPLARPLLGRPDVPLIVTEGVRKADAALSVLGVPAVALMGVWNWRGRNDDGGMTALADWEYVHLKGRRVIVALDSDVMVRADLHQALGRLGRFLTHRGAEVLYAYLPHGEHGAKVGLDDWLAEGRDLDALLAVCSEQLRRPEVDEAEPESYSPPEPRDLEQVLDAYRRFLRFDDPAPILLVLGTYAANHLAGEPVWLGVVGGSSRGKTEVVMGLADCPGVVTASSISGKAALLSATSAKERAADATGGLLARIGASGTLVLKDFTSVLDMNRDARADVLGALREVYDGSWARDVGTDGGRQLTWTGKLGLVFGVTTAIDSAHGVMSRMGERFLLCRVDVGDDIDLAEVALHSGDGSEPRRVIAEAVAGLLAHLDYSTAPELTDDLAPVIKGVATFVARSRSPVEWDYKQTSIELVGDPESPTRLVKALDRLRAGLLLIGVEPAEVRRLLVKVALDSIPKPRRLVLDHLLEQPGLTTTKALAAKLDLPTKTVGRRLSELAAHGMVKRHAGADLKGDDDDYDGRADYWELTPWALTLVSMFETETSEGVKERECDDTLSQTTPNNPNTTFPDISVPNFVGEDEGEGDDEVDADYRLRVVL